MKMKVFVDDGAERPVRGHAIDAGLDLKAPKDIYIPPKGAVVVDTGVHVQLPAGTVGMLKSKSGLNVRCSIVSEGVIDEGYTGSIVAKLYNHSKNPVNLFAGDKITQLVILPVIIPEIEYVNTISDFDESERGANGFGSTGR